MATRRGIEAGKAYVEGRWDDSRIVRGMKATSRSLRKFGSGMRRVGAGAIGIATSIVAPLTATSKLFANMGDQIGKMAVRTGFSAEALSQLQFAAEQSGASVESLEAAILKMNRRIGRITAGQGSGSEIKSLKALGLTAAELQKMNPEQRFNAIADAMANMTDKAEAAGLAQRAFGTGVDKILPLLLQGSEGINKLRKQADDLGITLSTKSVKAAEKFTDQLNILRRVVLAKLFSVGAAVAPMIGRFAEQVSRVAGPVGKWIDRNRGLVATIFAIGVALIGGGGLLVALGAVVSAIGTLIGAAGALSGALAFLGPAGWLLLGVSAVAALGGALIYASQSGESLADTMERINRLIAESIRLMQKRAEAARDRGQEKASLRTLKEEQSRVDRLILAEKERLQQAKQSSNFDAGIIPGLSSTLADPLIDTARETEINSAEANLEALKRQAAAIAVEVEKTEASLKERQNAPQQPRPGGNGFSESSFTAADAKKQVATQREIARLSKRAAEIRAEIRTEAERKAEAERAAELPAMPPEVQRTIQNSVNTMLRVGQASGNQALFRAISQRARITPGEKLIAEGVTSLEKTINKNHRELKKGNKATIQTPMV